MQTVGFQSCNYFTPLILFIFNRQFIMPTLHTVTYNQDIDIFFNLLTVLSESALAMIESNRLPPGRLMT